MKIKLPMSVNSIVASTEKRVKQTAANGSSKNSGSKSKMYENHVRTGANIQAAYEAINQVNDNALRRSMLSELQQAAIDCMAIAVQLKKKADAQVASEDDN
jgi:rRNA maturation endonuclease Nob1